jgi:hypothetical protein
LALARAHPSEPTSHTSGCEPDQAPSTAWSGPAKFACDLEDFLTPLHTTAEISTVEKRQRVLRLLIKDILIGPIKITTRRRILWGLDTRCSIVTCIFRVVSGRG